MIGPLKMKVILEMYKNIYDNSVNERYSLVYSLKVIFEILLIHLRLELLCTTTGAKDHPRT